MATAYQNLSACDNNTVPYSPQLRVAVVCAEWNADITGQLLKGACDTLEKHGVKPENIRVEARGGVDTYAEASFNRRVIVEIVSSEP